MEGTKANITGTLQSVLATLEELEARGKRNHTIIIAVMNSIEQLLKSLEGKEVIDSGDIHAQS